MSVQIRIIRINCHALFVTIPFALRIVSGTVKTLAARRVRTNVIEEVLPIHLRFAIQAHHHRSVLGPVEFILFRIKIRLCPLCPVFFVTSFILLKFFIVLNKRKNWETGQKCENPLIFLGFLLPTFVLKTGQKVGRGPFSVFFAFHFSTKTGQKLASAHFLEYKTGQKLGG